MCHSSRFSGSKFELTLAIQKIEEQKNEQSGQILRLRNENQALERMIKQTSQIEKEEINFDSKTFKFQVKIKNMLGGFSDCMVLIRKKFGGKFVIVLEERNGDETEISLNKLFKVSIGKTKTCDIFYKTVFQRKISFELGEKSKRKSFRMLLKKALVSAGAKDIASIFQIKS